MSQNRFLKEINQALLEIEEDVAENDDILRHSQARSDNVMTLFFVFIISFALVNFYFVFEWTKEAAAMIHEVEEVHVNLDKITDNMVVINGSMQQMRAQTLLVPILDEEMNSFVSSMEAMTQHTDSMHQSITQVNQSMNTINQDMQNMQQRFSNLNRSVDAMARDVNEMSRVMP